jgi:chromosomal replication initiation ATPase DnaA
MAILRLICPRDMLDRPAMKPSQIPFELPVASADSREDLIVGAANAMAAEMIDAWPDWPGNVVVMCGPPGSGKSHLARIWSKRADAVVVQMHDFGAMAPAHMANMVIEDAEPGDIDERGLFHLLNLLRAERRHCLLTSRHLPVEWNVSLPDLKSRIGSAQLVLLREPDDEMLRLVMFKLFADRQLSPEPGVVAYICARMERSLEGAVRVVGEIDREALARSKCITRAVAAAALRRLGMG